MYFHIKCYQTKRQKLVLVTPGLLTTCLEPQVWMEFPQGLRKDQFYCEIEPGVVCRSGTAKVMQRSELVSQSVPGVRLCKDPRSRKELSNLLPCSKSDSHDVTSWMMSPVMAITWHVEWIELKTGCR